MKRKEILEGWGRKNYGYDDYGYSLAPGHDEGEPVYNPDYDIAGGGPPRRSGSYSPRPAESNADFHLRNTKTGKLLSKDGKPSVFSGERHARAVAAKLKFGSWEPVPVKEQSVSEGSDDLRAMVLDVLNNIHDGALAGEEMIDDIADELGDFYDEVEQSGDETLMRAYRLAREEGADAEGNPEQMAQVIGRAIGMLSQEDTTDVSEEEDNDTFDQKSHQYKTTMKHAKNPTVQQRMAAHDIKPGIAGYRDRIDMLQDLERTGRAKDDDEPLDVEADLHDLAHSGDWDEIYRALGRDDEVGRKLQDMANEISYERGLHADDDIEQIIDIIANQLEQEYGVDEEIMDSFANGVGEGYYYEGDDEDSKKELSVDELAAISDEALDKAYGYGRSNPGNTFGWQANLKSAEFAKRAIESGITDIDQIADAIHDGWNVTARQFVKNPFTFDDTEKLKAAGKLEAKLAQREKLMNIEYSQLPDEEQEKDRVVARALLQALKGDSNLDEVDQMSQQKVSKINPDGTAELTDPTGKITKVKQTDLQPDTKDPTGKALQTTVSAPENQIKPGAAVNVTTKATPEAVHRQQGVNPMGQDELGSTHTQSTISGEEDHDEVSKLLVKDLRRLAGL